MATVSNQAPNKPANNGSPGSNAGGWISLAPALFVLLWSTGFIGAKLGAPYAEPFTFLSLRFAIAAVLFAIIAVGFRVSWPGRLEALHSVVVGILVHGLYLGPVFWAIDHGMSAGVTALIIGLQPLITAILAGLMLGEELALRHWLGLSLGLAGLVLVLGPKLDLAGSGITLFSIGIVAAGVLSITLGTLYQKRHSAASDLRTGGACQYLGAFAVCAAGALLLEQGHVEWTGEFVFALGWLVLVLSLGAVLLLMVLIRHGAVSQVATLFYLVAPVTALIGWLIFGETLTPLQLFGMAVTVAGVAIAGRRWRQVQT